MQLSLSMPQVAYLLWNMAAFLLVMLDKQRAKQGDRRIRERTFFLWAAFLGAAGVLAGMYAFRHKTRHWSFRIGIPLLLLINIACWYYAATSGIL